MPNPNFRFGRRANRIKDKVWQPIFWHDRMFFALELLAGARLGRQPRLKSEPTSAEFPRSNHPSSWKYRFWSIASNSASASPLWRRATKHNKISAAICRSKRHREKGGGRRRINVTSNPANKEVPFFNDNIFPPYSIVMSHVAVENVHGLEQQVRRTPAIFLFSKMLLASSVEWNALLRRGMGGGDKWLARRLARKKC